MTPDIVDGEWLGEIVGTASLNLGQLVQDGPPRQSVEFSYLILPTLLTMPRGQFRWPGIVMIMVPTPLKTDQSDAGSLNKAPNLPSLSLSLDVTPAQFSDILRMLELKRLKSFHFTVEPERGGSWPIRSWGMGATIA